MNAGDLKDRLQFEMRGEKKDGYGNSVASEWTPQFDRHGNIRYLRGGESVTAARLEARQPAILSVRVGPRTSRIAAEWRAVEMINGKPVGRVFNIREKPTLTDDGAFYQMFAESGVAT
jgi:head-tail adaptor